MEFTTKQNHTVLIVDEAELCQDAEAMIRQLNYRCKRITEGDEMIDLLTREKIGLILIHEKQINKDPHELCSMLKMNPFTRKHMLFLVIEDTSKKNIEKVFESGANDYLTFPFNENELGARLGLVMENLEEKEQLESAESSRSQLLSVIAHDLRNPFNVLLGYSSRLLKKFPELDDQKKLRYIRIIEETLLKTYQLLDNLLYWSRSQSGKVSLSPATFSFSELAMNTTQLLNSAAINKDITLECNVPSEIEVYADRDMIATILRNLLTNSLKFTPKGGKVTIEAKEENEYCVVRVIDNGKGIPAEQQKELFVATGIKSSRGTSGESGTGLGLPVCRDFIEHNRGTISVESEEGKGSAFIITIPTTPFQ